MCFDQSQEQCVYTTFHPIWRCVISLTFYHLQHSFHKNEESSPVLPQLLQTWHVSYKYLAVSSTSVKSVVRMVPTGHVSSTLRDHVAFYVSVNWIIVGIIIVIYKCPMMFVCFLCFWGGFFFMGGGGLHCYGYILPILKIFPNARIATLKYMSKWMSLICNEV